jgi:hypothetical protein
VSIFIADIDKIDNIKLERKEAIIEMFFYAKNEFEDLIRKGKITDGFTLSAYTLAKINGYFK